MKELKSLSTTVHPPKFIIEFLHSFLFVVDTYYFVIAVADIELIGKSSVSNVPFNTCNTNSSSLNIFKHKYLYVVVHVLSILHIFSRQGPKPLHFLNYLEITFLYLFIFSTLK